jgi:hypothetical protein
MAVPEALPRALLLGVLRAHPVDPVVQVGPPVELLARAEVAEPVGLGSPQRVPTIQNTICVSISNRGSLRGGRAVTKTRS